jgi:voltage-gated sodium channel
MTERLRHLVAHPAFDAAVMIVILANAVVLGLQTYDAIERDHGDTLNLLNGVFLGVFVVELGLRMASYGRAPWRFFLDPWNVFDFAVVALAFTPGFRQNSTILRLARLLRVVRIVRLLPELRILVTAIARSIPPLFSMALLTTLILFVYGMVGWALFGDEDPDHWGDIGQAMLTLFVMLTLENLPARIETGMEIEPWSVVYFISFVLVAAFIILNVLIGVVLHSMDEARQIHVEQELREQGLEPTEEEVDVISRIRRLREAIDELEDELKLTAGSRRRP